MRISLSVTNYTWPTGSGGIAQNLGEVARACDQGGLHTLWVADHLLQADPSCSLEDEMLEAYTTLGFLAAHTEHVRLGTMVTGVTFRPPALLVKAITTLDVLSEGRAWLGIGAGYEVDEAQAMGLAMPPIAERFERLEEAIEIAKQMWSGDASPYEGRHDHLTNPIGSPAPLSRPHPPILIGGTGERRTLRLVAEHADACNVFDIPDGGQTVRHKLDVLARHCGEVGRAYDEIEKTISTGLAPGESSDSFVERCRTIGGLGIDHVVVITRGEPWTPALVGTLAAAVPQVQDI